MSEALKKLWEKRDTLEPRTKLALAIEIMTAQQLRDFAHVLVGSVDDDVFVYADIVDSFVEK